jgi:Uma2 family endonuclease
MSISTAKMTARQFLQLGEDPPGVRLELVDGEIAVSPSPNFDHSHVEKNLSFILLGHIRKKDLGELVGDVDTIFGEFDVRRPDIIYIAKRRVNAIVTNVIEGSPDLCIEILSPSSDRIDRQDKFKQYQDARVAFYWIIDPQERTIEAFELKNRKYRSAGSGKGNQTVRLPPFPDLDIPLADLWFTRKR